MSFKSGSSKTKQSSQSQSDPWDETLPQLREFLAKLSPEIGAPGGPSTAQTGAFGQLEQNAGNPFASNISSLTSRLFGARSEAPTVGAGYADLTRRLTPYANGANLNVESNPYIQDILQKTTSDAVNRTNQYFAGAGRDLSRKNTDALGTAITNAQLPVLADLYKDAENKSLDAAKTLFSGGVTTGSTVQDLNTRALGTNATGIDASKAAVEARDLGPNTVLSLEQQIKSLPLDRLAQIAGILFPAAGLGQQATGTGTSSTKQSGFGLDVGKLLFGPQGKLGS